MNGTSRIIPIHEYKKQAPGCDAIFALECDDGDGLNLSLIEGGPDAFLWFGRNNQYIASASGVKALRALANAILKEIGPTKPKRKK